jgi:hypothetical protein
MRPGSRQTVPFCLAPTACAVRCPVPARRRAVAGPSREARGQLRTLPRSRAASNSALNAHRAPPGCCRGGAPYPWQNGIARHVVTLHARHVAAETTGGMSAALGAIESIKMRSP